MLDPRTRKTIAHVESAIDEERTSAINDMIHIIQELAGKAFSISIQDLSQLIGRDPTITERVISAANTLGFNPSGTPVNTIGEAIHTVGFETIRNLAISLMLAETAGLNQNSYEQREAAALAVCSGMFAQSFASRMSECIDTELLFVCASLRNYGKLILSSFLTEQYREALGLTLEMPEDEAFQQTFGLTPLALGRRLLHSTTLPKDIKASLRDTDPGTLSRPPQSAEDEILIIAELSACVCAAVFHAGLNPEGFEEELARISEVFRGCLPVSVESIGQCLMEVEAQFSQLNSVVGIRDDRSVASLKLRARLGGDDLPEAPPASRLRRRPVPKRFEEMNREERDQYAEDSFQEATAALAALIVPGERVSLQDVYQTVAKTILEGLGLENCLVFVREEFDPQNLSARYGYGRLFDRVKNRPVIGPQKKDIFSICLARREDVLIQDSAAGKISSVVPDWIHLAGEVSSFIVLPVSLEKRLFAILLGTVSQGRVVALQDGDLRRLRALRGQLADLKKLIESNAVVAR